MGKEKTPKKEKADKTPKKEKVDDEEEDEGSKKQLLLSPIANPLAGKKLTKKALKTIKKASGAKAIRRGVKEVVKAIKKDTKGLCIIAGNISPLDVIAHVPILCEEKGIPYCYVPSKEDLGLASLTKRPTSIVLVTCGADFKEAYDELQAEMIAVAPKFTPS